MRPINLNNDISNPSAYINLTSINKGCGIVAEIYGCYGKEWFVVGRSEQSIYLWDGDAWKTRVKATAKTYKKDADSILVGGSRCWNDIKHNLPKIPKS